MTCVSAFADRTGSTPRSWSSRDRLDVPRALHGTVEPIARIAIADESELHHQDSILRASDVAVPNTPLIRTAAGIQQAHVDRWRAHLRGLHQAGKTAR